MSETKFQQSSDDELKSFLLEVLDASSRLYHCNATNCPCGDGKRALESAPTWLEAVTDEQSAKAFIDGVLMVSWHCSETIAKQHWKDREFVALVMCEAARIGGLLTEAQIQAAIDAQAIREAEAEEKSSKPANPPKPAQIPNPLAFVPGPKSIREN